MLDLKLGIYGSLRWTECTVVVMASQTLGALEFIVVHSLKDLVAVLFEGYLAVVVLQRLHHDVALRLLVI